MELSEIRRLLYLFLVVILFANYCGTLLRYTKLISTLTLLYFYRQIITSSFINQLHMNYWHIELYLYDVLRVDYSTSLSKNNWYVCIRFSRKLHVRGSSAIYEVKERFRPIKCKSTDDAPFLFFLLFYFIRNYAPADHVRWNSDRLER